MCSEKTIMYRILGTGLLGLFALLAIPAIQEELQTSYMGGMATMVVHNALGEEIMFQQVHNRIIDEGEKFIVNQLFANGTTAGDGAGQIALICPFIKVNQDIQIDEQNDTRTFVNTDENSATGIQCLEGFRVDLNGVNATAGAGGTNGTAVIGNATGLPFGGQGTAQGTIGDGDILRGIGIFTGIANANAPIEGTNTLFALVDTGDVTVGNTDIVNISYTFDISDPAN